MRASRRNLSWLAFTLLAFGLLPLKTDGVDTACCTVSTSTLSSIAEPVSGDEDFFALPTGPSAVMFLLDNSGSMTDFPQCDNGGWGAASCNYPSVAAPSFTTPTATTNPSSMTSPPGATTAGTCDKASLPSDTQWMADITPAAVGSYADPGFSGGTGGVNDTPPWSGLGGCSGNNCLFDTGAYYHYGSWTETTATPVTRASPCAALDSSGNVIKDKWGNDVKDYSGRCQACLDAHGFYFMKFSYVSNWAHHNASGGNPEYWTYTVSTWPSASGNPELRFRGTYLNANPPKYVSARRAVKELLKIDDTANLQPRDFIRYGLATFWNTTSGGTDIDNGNGSSGTVCRFGGVCESSSGPVTGDGAKLVVPLGPNCDDSDPSLSPPHTTAIVAARNAIINAVNATGTQMIRFNNYTPLGEALFNVGQYFSDTGAPGAYQSRFGATWIKKGCPSYSSAGVCAYNDIAAPTTTGSAGAHYDASQDFRESSAGLVGASWAAPGQNQHSACFACQQSAIIVVTDGMPNNEAGLPSSSVTTNHTNQGTSAWDFQRWQPTDYRSACGANRGASGDGCASYLPLVALYLKQQDQRLNDFTSGFQNVTTSTISFGVTDAQALKVLSATSSLGGGVPSQAGSYSDLIASLQKAIS
ncbi:MAG TPA: hypothetical protein VI300_29795, partial [Solirubrobacter sp.]